VKQDRQAVSAVSSRTERSTREWFALALATASIVIVGIQLVLYYRSEAWQTLVAAACVGLGGLLAMAAYVLVQRRKDMLAAYFVLLGLLFAYGGGELVLSGMTAYLAAGGCLVIFLAGRAFLPRQWRVWLVTAVLHGIILFFINWLEPLSRYDTTEVTMLGIQLPAITGLLALLALWQLVRALRGVGTIRNRLLVSFVVVVLLPVNAIGIGIALVGLPNVQRQLLDHLDSVAILKEAEISTWLDDLQIDLTVTLSGAQVLAHVSAATAETPGSQAYEQASERLRGRLLQTLEQTGRYDELFIIDLDGNVVASTDIERQGESLGSQSYFREGLKDSFIQPPKTTTTGRTSVTLAQPIMGDHGEALGVLAGHAKLDKLYEIMGERSGLGTTGETYLIGASQTLLTPSRLGTTGAWQSSPGIERAVRGKASGSGEYENPRGDPVLGAYRWLPRLQAALLAEREQAEASRTLYITMAVVGGAALLSILAAIGISLLITRAIATPLASLAQTAAQIAGGDLSQTASLQRDDEIGALAQAFNSMTGQLRELISSLEQRVADRTRELEWRSAYLEAASEVGTAATSILDPEQLLEQAVVLLCERFDLYYVGLFLTDRTGEWAVLQANAGRTGRPLPERGERLRVGSGSMIGWSIANAEARIALDASRDTQRMVRTELPETRSEAALLLRARGTVIGALTVQHTEPGAFDQDTIVVLQTAADQIAVALENARLLTEHQEALETAQRAYGELSQQAWHEILRGTAVPGFRSDAHGISAADDTWRPEMEQALQTGEIARSDGQDTGLAARQLLAVPIKARGQVVGVLDTYKPAESGRWSDGEVQVLEAIADQLGEALESARLYEETQRRAAREESIRYATEQMRSAVDVEAILQNTVAELAKALGVPRAYVRLGTEAELQPGGSRSRPRAEGPSRDGGGGQGIA
jgi:GAF domain-containing protein/HAMP domain-containing protein